MAKGHRGRSMLDCILKAVFLQSVGGNGHIFPHAGGAPPRVALAAPGGISRTENQQPDPQMPMVDLDQSDCLRLAHGLDHAPSHAYLQAWSLACFTWFSATFAISLVTAGCPPAVVHGWQCSLGQCCPSPLRCRQPWWIADSELHCLCTPGPFTLASLRF